MYSDKVSRPMTHWSTYNYNEESETAWFAFVEDIIKNNKHEFITSSTTTTETETTPQTTCETKRNDFHEEVGCQTHWGNDIRVCHDVSQSQHLSQSPTFPFTEIH